VFTHISGTERVVLLVLSIVFGALGFWLSERDRKTLGRTPWGLPSVIWALFWFLSLLLGLVLFVIAHSSAVRRAGQTPPPPMPGASSYQRPDLAAPPSVADQFPAYPRPANTPTPTAWAGEPDPGSATPPEGHAPEGGPGSGQVAEGATGAGQAAEGATGSGQTAAGQTGSGQTAEQPGPPLSPPAWHPDPSGRFHYRWWDGSQWTSHVAINGYVVIDTSPDQRIGPY
jgi:Protein of unknown function (DUF2510)